MFPSDARNMSDDIIVNVVPEPKHSKRSKSKESQTLAREFAPLKDYVGLDGECCCEGRKNDIPFNPNT